MVYLLNMVIFHCYVSSPEGLYLDTLVWVSVSDTCSIPGIMIRDDRWLAGKPPAISISRNLSEKWAPFNMPKKETQNLMVKPIL